MTFKHTTLLAAGSMLALALLGGQAQARQTADSSWITVSRSTQKIYLVDLGRMRQADGVTIVQVARTPVQRAAADDYSYAVDELELRCADDQSRATTSLEYGPDGVELDRYEDPSPWAAIQAGTLDAYVKAIVCDGAGQDSERWPTVRAYMDAGQP